MITKELEELAEGDITFVLDYPTQTKDLAIVVAVGGGAVQLYILRTHKVLFLTLYQGYTGKWDIIDPAVAQLIAGLT